MSSIKPISTRKAIFYTAATVGALAVIYQAAKEIKEADRIYDEIIEDLNRKVEYVNGTGARLAADPALAGTLVGAPDGTPEDDEDDEVAALADHPETLARAIGVMGYL